MNEWLNQFQQDCEDNFKLDCNEEDIESNKEAMELHKYLKKQKKRIEHIDREMDKIFSPKPRENIIAECFELLNMMEE